MTVEIWLKETSQPLNLVAQNTYTKGPFFCVYDGKKVYKFPVSSIFRVVESYKQEKL